MPETYSNALKIIASSLINDQKLDLHDREFLATVLSYHDVTLDCEKVASALFDEFETLAAIVAAPFELLSAVPGITRHAVALLKFMNEFDSRSRRSRLPERIRIAKSEELKSYLHQRLANARHEEFHILFLDNNWQLLRDEMISRGCVDRCAVYPRQVLKRALELGASKLVLIHNHPSRRTDPSFDDLKATHDITVACGSVGIAIEDHVIIAGNEFVSMRELGLLGTAQNQIATALR